MNVNSRTLALALALGITPAVLLTGCNRNDADDVASNSPADAASAGAMGSDSPGGLSGTDTAGAGDTGSTTGSTAGGTGAGSGNVAGTGYGATGTAGTTGAAGSTGAAADGTGGMPGGSMADASPSGTSTTSGSANPNNASPNPNDLMQSNPTGAGNAGSTLGSLERQFITQAAEAGLHELQVAQLAADKASDPAVKSYAAMLVQDHQAANDRLRQLAASHGVTLPSSPPQSKQSEIDKLQKASGADFDRQFVQAVGVKDHQKDIALFERTSREAKDASVRDFALSTLPTLRAHLAAAEKLPGSSGRSGGGGTGTSGGTSGSR